MADFPQRKGPTGPINSSSGGGGTLAETLRLGNTTGDGIGNRSILLSDGDAIEDEAPGMGFNLRTKDGLLGLPPSLMFIDLGDGLAGQFGGTLAGQSGKVVGGGARCTWLFGSASDTQSAGFSFQCGGAGEGGNIDSGMFIVGTGNKAGSGRQGYFLVNGPGAFLGLEARASLDSTVAIGTGGYWNKSGGIDGSVPMFRRDTGLELEIALVTHNLPVKARTTTTIPAYTYANGAGGRGATISGNAFAVFPNLDGGVVINVGDYFYLSNGASATDNGVYQLNVKGDGATVGFMATRVPGFDTLDTIPDSYFHILKGSQYAGSIYSYTATAAIIVGTTRLFWKPNTYRTPNAGIFYYDDFGFAVYPTISTSDGPGELTFNATGAAAGYAPRIVGENTASRRGLVRMKSGTIANNLVGMSDSWTVSATDPDGAGCIQCSQNTGIKHEALVSNLILSTAAKEYARNIGFARQRANGQVLPADGIVFSYNRLVSLNWLATCSTGGVPTTVDTGVPVVAGQYDRMTINKDAGANSVQFLINGNVVATITTNIPNGVMLGSLDVIFNSVGVADTTYYSNDYMLYDIYWPEGRVP